MFQLGATNGPGGLPLLSTAQGARRVAILALTVILIATPPLRGVVATDDRPQGTPTPSFIVDSDIPADEGIVRGQVVEAGSRLPVGGAEVRLTANPRRGADGLVLPAPRPPGVAVSSESSSALTQTTDSRGRFEFRRVPRALYGVEVVAPGYLRGYFGNSASSRAAIPLQVRGGEAVSNVNVELVRPSAVSGRVLSDDGKGLGGVEVELLREAYRNGGVMLAPAGAAATTDGGGFRFADILPGQYYVLAYAGKAMRPTAGVGLDRYAPTLYAGATRIDQAQPLALTAGQELFGIDISLIGVRSHVVSGRVLETDGTPARGAIQVMSLNGVSESANMRTGLLGTLDEEGRFVAAGLVPGDYLVLVFGRAKSIDWTGPLYAEVVTVDDDLTDLQIVTQLPARLEGRVMLANGDAPPFDATALNIGTQQRWRGGIYSPGAFGRVVQADGAFAIHSAARQVWLHVRDLPSPWIVESVLLNGMRVTDQPLTLAPGSRHRLDVVVTDRGSRLAGQVTDRDGRPVAHAAILLFPRDPAMWSVERRTRTTSSRADGSYSMDDLPPGDYQATAVNSLPTAWRAPEALEQFGPSSTAVRLRAGEAMNQPLRLSPTPAGLLDP